MKRGLGLLLFVCAFFFSPLAMAGLCECPNPSSGTCTFYVSPGGTGDCSDANNSCEFQHALDQSACNSSNNTIHLAQGTYTSSPDAYSYSTFSAMLSHSLTIIGHVTDNIPDAVIQNNTTAGLFINSKGAISVQNISFEHNTSTEEDVAGGLTIWTSSDGSSVEVTGNHFLSNENTAFDGGGLYIYTGQSNSSITLTGNTFEDNKVDEGSGYSGGGAYLQSNGAGGNFEISNNTFSGNQADVGGALYVSLSQAANSFTMNANLISGNKGTKGGPSGFILFVYSPVSSPLVLSNNIIVGNQTTYSSDAEVNTGAMLIYVGSSSTLNFVNNTVANNSILESGGYGGALLLETPNAPIYNFYNNLFWNNSVQGDPKAGEDIYIYLDESDTQFTLNNNDLNEICIQGPDILCNSGNDFSSLNVFSSFSELNNLVGEDPLFKGTGSGVNPYRVASASKVVKAGAADAPSIPATDYEDVTMSSPPTLGALQTTYTPAQLTVTVSPVSDSAIVGNDFSWTVTVSNSGEDTTEDVTADVTAENQDILSGASASLSAIRMNDGSSVSCSGSSPLTCNLGVITSGSSVTFKVSTLVTAEGTLSLTANVSSNAGAVTGSGRGTATAGPAISSNDLSGAGCALNVTRSNSINMFWIYSLMMILPVVRCRLRKIYF